MEEPLDFVFEEKQRRGVSIAVVASIFLHALFIIYVIRNYRPIEVDQPAPMVRYVELIRQNKQFTEAPGPARSTAPINAPYSDANRKASTPKPTGEKPTTRPGDGGFYTPSSGSAPPSAAAAAAAARIPHEDIPVDKTPPAAERSTREAPTFTYRPAQANATVDWRNAIKEVGKIASLGTGQQTMDLGGGGDKGFAASGPMSFESQWYDWGPYAASMVSKIRVNWYNNMPRLIQTGIKGVVTIRFTIQRNGEITNIETLNSSTVPPYDFAARKAIELSSALNALPADFPNATERVTCMFFYNEEPPAR